MENIYLILGIFIVGGYFAGLLAEKIGLPKITGYILLGVIFSPSLFGLTVPEKIQGMGIITEISLSVVAFITGGSLNIKTIKKLGMPVIWITLIQGLGVWLFVGFSVYFFYPLFSTIGKSELFIMALTLGAVALPTAPAAIIAIIHEYKAKGPFTSTLLSVVVLDDALAIIATSISIGIAKSIVGSGSMSILRELRRGSLEILVSILIGMAVGFLSKRIMHYFKSSSSLLLLVTGSIFFSTGLSNILGVSYLLSNMVFGFFITNTFSFSDKYFTSIKEVEELIFVLFFTLAGAHFETVALKTAGILALIIVIGRVSGKFIGSYVGGVVSRAPENVRKYLGFALLPKAGVTLGLILLVLELPEIKDVGIIMINGILASVIINELISPPLVKFALTKSKEIQV
ncbi:MAG: cation:proton antiporter [Caldisericaceae bacterium]|nr:cation:proton antiporter [Caldisericaceae bacterium]